MDYLVEHNYISSQFFLQPGITRQVIS
jgi:hypothetical protein